MPCSEMLRRVPLVRTDFSEELRLHHQEALCSSETSVLTRTTRRNIPEDDVLQSHRRQNHKCYIALAGSAM
jgi:hypothetical protein